MSGEPSSLEGESKVGADISQITHEYLMRDFKISMEDASRLLDLFDAKYPYPDPYMEEVVLKISNGKILVFDPKTKQWSIVGKTMEPILNEANPDAKSVPPSTTGGPFIPPSPQTPYPYPVNPKTKLSQRRENFMRKKLVAAGVPEATIATTMCWPPEPGVEEDVLEPISVDLPTLRKIKKHLLKAGIKTSEMPMVMEPISVDSEDVMEPISVDLPSMKKLKKLFLKANKMLVAKGMTAEAMPMVMEPISVDEDEEDEEEVDFTIPGLSRFSGSALKKLKELLKMAGKKVLEPTRIGTFNEEAEVNTEDVFEPIHIGRAFELFNMGRGRWIVWKFPTLKTRYGGGTAGALPSQQGAGGQHFDSWDKIQGDECRGSVVFNLDTDKIVVKDGVLKAPCIMASSMVQDYEGTPILKCPDELSAAVKAAKQLPITDGHPKEKVVVSPDEIKGWTSIPTWNADKKRVECDVEITDPALIKKIKDEGKTSVSIGFTCTLDFKEGKFNDVPYKAIQRKMLLNHLAAGIDAGRCPTPKCGIAAEGDKCGTPTPEELAAKKKKDEEEQHVTLLKSKVADLASGISRIAENVASWSPAQFRDEWAKLTEIQADIQKLVEITKDSTSIDSAKATMSKLSDSAEAFKQVHLGTVKLVDSIMDYNPSKPREFYDSMNKKELEGIVSVIKKSDSASQSSSVSDAINDAYKEIIAKRHGR